MANKDSASELIRARDISGFDRWSLPSFDPDAPEPERPEEPQTAALPEPEPEPQIEEVPVEAVKPKRVSNVNGRRLPQGPSVRAAASKSTISSSR